MSNDLERTWVLLGYAISQIHAPMSHAGFCVSWRCLVVAVVTRCGDHSGQGALLLKGDAVYLQLNDKEEAATSSCALCLLSFGPLHQDLNGKSNVGELGLL